jgi:hypothetical protein
MLSVPDNSGGGAYCVSGARALIGLAYLCRLTPRVSWVSTLCRGRGLNCVRNFGDIGGEL